LATTSETTLPRTLGLRDLVLAQILYLTIPEFFGTAAKAGAYQLALWSAAILLFYIPEAMVVSRLNRLFPLEGGLYEWARIAFGDRIGFLVAWNLWLYVVVYMAMAGLLATSFVAYAIGPGAAWLTANKSLTVTTCAVLICALVLVTRLGMGLGKWITNAGSVLTILTIGVLIAMPFVHLWRGTLTGYRPLTLAAPPLNLFSLSVFSKMTFGALCGFEFVAIFAGECRDPERNLSRSILISAPIIALLYILGSSAILAFVPTTQVDVVAAIPQALTIAFHDFPISRFILTACVIALLTNYISTFNINFGAAARLPMVAGWDHLLPGWFTRLHPKYKTPVNSTLFAGAVALSASMAVMIGVKEQEAFELLLIWAFTFYATAYLAMFAIPLFARRLEFDLGWKLRVAAVSGFLVTLLYVVLSVFPVIDVPNPTQYALKTGLVILIANIGGVVLYGIGQQKS
jgi:amino acid transporter